MTKKVTLADKFATFTETWAPRIVARYEGHEVRIAKLEGAFDWHSHTHDELFLCLDGELDIEFRERTETLHPGDLLLIAAGEEHKPVARKGEVQVLLLDPANAPNTGDEKTATIAVEA
ncbi:MAG: mannose-6-phosphate isomerase [Erythrobacter sp.]|nr:mannose-6-phosphate isomerase [Erythrobacter sp.]|tara:strand:- start:535 stop:888 length:354 start_codon:yes stop_codon:yes gene_type:complete